MCANLISSIRMQEKREVLTLLHLKRYNSNALTIPRASHASIRVSLRVRKNTFILELKHMLDN